MNPGNSLEEVEAICRRMYDFIENLEVRGAFKCPCCGYRTLSELAGYEVCEVCFWEDDGQDDHDADDVWGGPNYELSLTQARGNFKSYGACAERYIKYVRNPSSEETSKFAGNKAID